MNINNVGGSQPIDNNQNTSNNIQQQVEQYKNSIFEQCDTDKSGKIDEKNKNGENEVKKFNNLVQAFIQKISGKEEPEKAVDGLTNAPEANGVEPEFDASGNVKTDVIKNEDGSKDIKAGDETIHVSQSGDSISVTSDSGRKVALIKTPDGGFEFTDEDGKVHKFDQEMNPAA